MPFPRSVLPCNACIPILLASALSCHCGDLRLELNERSRKDGLGLASYGGKGRIEIRHFGREKPNFILAAGLRGLYDVGPSNLILGTSTGPTTFGSPGLDSFLSARLAIYSPTGQIIEATGLNVAPRLASFAPAWKLIAALLVDGKRQKASLLYGGYNWESTHEVFSVSLPDDSTFQRLTNFKAESFSWSPSKPELVYSTGGSVYIFDTVSGLAREIGNGSDPCWSPDGSAIVFRSREHNLVVYRVTGARVTSLTTGMDVLGFPKWSPDSKYVLFAVSTEVKLGRSPVQGTSSAFTVLRISDRATTVVMTPGMGMTSDGFYWTSNTETEK
jgi:hypothetical protein